MGKTSVVLQWIKDQIWLGKARRFLIVAPLQVMYQVWPEQIAAWSNFRGLTYSLCHGSPDQRRRRLSLATNISLINWDNCEWLVRLCKGRQVPWDAIVFDESTAFKNWEAKRSAAARALASRIPRRVIMTGTPSPRNLADIYPQLFLLDRGRHIGCPDVNTFRQHWCYTAGSRGSDFRVREDRKAALTDAIQPLCLRLDIRDYLSMPPMVTNTIRFELPPAAREKYDTLERELFIELEQGGSRSVPNAAAKYHLCRQVAGGAIYDEERTARTVHDAAIEAAVGVIDELQGKSVLIAYQYSHEVERLQKAIRGLKVIRGSMPSREVNALVNGWNDGTVTRLAVQPQALSYGVNMQHGPGRDIIWFGPTDNLDHYTQLNARIFRQGVTSTVRIHRLSAVNTIHEMIWDRTDAKFDVQSSLLQCLKEWHRSRRGG